MNHISEFGYRRSSVCRCVHASNCFIICRRLANRWNRLQIYSISDNCFDVRFYLYLSSFVTGSIPGRCISCQKYKHTNWTQYGIRFVSIKYRIQIETQIMKNKIIGFEYNDIKIYSIFQQSSLFGFSLFHLVPLPYSYTQRKKFL